MGKYMYNKDLIDVVIKQVARGQEDEALAEAKITKALHEAHADMKALHHPSFPRILSCAFLPACLNAACLFPSDGLH